MRNKAEQLSQQRMFQSSLLKFSSTTANNGHRATVNLPKKRETVQDSTVTGLRRASRALEKNYIARSCVSNDPFF